MYSSFNFKHLTEGAEFYAKEIKKLEKQDPSGYVVQDLKKHSLSEPKFGKFGENWWEKEEENQ